MNQGQVYQADDLESYIVDSTESVDDFPQNHRRNLTVGLVVAAVLLGTLGFSFANRDNSSELTLNLYEHYPYDDSYYGMQTQGYSGYQNYPQQPSGYSYSASAAQGYTAPSQSYAQSKQYAQPNQAYSESPSQGYAHATQPESSVLSNFVEKKSLGEKALLKRGMIQDPSQLSPGLQDQLNGVAGGLGHGSVQDNLFPPEHSVGSGGQHDMAEQQQYYTQPSLEINQPQQYQQQYDKKPSNIAQAPLHDFSQTSYNQQQLQYTNNQPENQLTQHGNSGGQHDVKVSDQQYYAQPSLEFNQPQQYENKKPINAAQQASDFSQPSYNQPQFQYTNNQYENKAQQYDYHQPSQQLQYTNNQYESQPQQYDYHQPSQQANKKTQPANDAQTQQYEFTQPSFNQPQQQQYSNNQYPSMYSQSQSGLFVGYKYP